MCGRFTLKTAPSEWVQQLFPGLTILDLPAFAPRYNIAPTQSIVTLIGTDDATSLRVSMMRWGLVPSWSADLAIGSSMINARGETVAEKPSFRKAFLHRRCIIVADGYYEWLRSEKSKRPFWIHRKDGHVFCMAGLWEANQKAVSEGTLLTTTVITTPANRTTSAVHDRMPVILEPEDALRWIDPKLELAEQILPLIRSAPEQLLELTEVSSHVNNARHEGPECIRPVNRGNDSLF